MTYARAAGLLAPRTLLHSYTSTLLHSYNSVISCVVHLDCTTTKIASLKNIAFGFKVTCKKREAHVKSKILHSTNFPEGKNFNKAIDDERIRIKI